MKCAKCETGSLIAITVNGTEVDRCNMCGGIWFDEKELSTLLEAELGAMKPVMDAPDDDQLNRRPAICPRDGEVLLRVYSARNREVVLDTCAKCRGIWLDGGEFERLKKE